MIGKTISHYNILEEIGSGGMGIVYKAQDTVLKRHVALKFLPPESTRNKEARERFIHEAQSASALDHPNICTIYEIANTDDDQIYIAMGYYEGETLKERINKGPINRNEVIDIVTQIAHGLAKAYEKGIIHRDIKPANIFITKEGIVKIFDFGLAKLSGQTQLTKSGSTLGTVAYMSPEQAKGEEVDHLTDIWSLGVLMYEMFTGQLPFKGDYEQAVVYSIINEEPEPLIYKSSIGPGLAQIVDRILKKDPQSRYSSVDELLHDLVEYQKRESGLIPETSVFTLLMRYLRKPRFAIPAVVSILLLSIITIWFFNRRAEIGWAQARALIEIEQFLDEENYPEAFKLVQKAKKYMSDDPDFKDLAFEATNRLTILSDPLGADVYIRVYSDTIAEWEKLGKTPIDSIKVPNYTIYRMKFEKAGYENILAVVSTEFDTVLRKLFKVGSIPPGMVYVEGYSYEWPSYYLKEKNGFFMDRYEVTNKQFKEFVDAGGYRNPVYWKHAFISDGKSLTWEEAIAEFTDKTGQPGPATWEASDYPDGQENYPVSGVSWFEAAAYAEYAGKSLPTGWHWGSGSGVFIDQSIRNSHNSRIVPFSNFIGSGTEPVGKFQGVNMFGVYDMAGNVREWCFNKTQAGRIICGGAWDDAEYMYSFWSQLPPLDRSPKNGVRCVQYIDPDKIHVEAFQPIQFRERTDYSKLEPVSDVVFRIYKNQFLYDKTDLEAKIEERYDSDDEWIMEKITFNAAYGNERVIAYLYLPKNATPPYQTLIYFPGLGAVYTKNELGKSSWSIWFIDYFMKSGRAVMLPVYKGTSVRNDGLTGEMSNVNQSHQFTEWLIAWTKDFSRSIDYLETRSDIDTSKLGFLGWSWGGEIGAVIPAVEERLKVNLLVLGGFTGTAYPEADPINYLPRIKIPVLMLNGKYDIWRPYETNLKPFYDLLGTPEKDKHLILYETDHYIPKRDMIKENLAWLDKYFGPPNK
jgi:tRNA A-37 threonylcarbamoyl transferase component Bud32/dienelactone hydrolase